jgi:hypothetical protein
MSDRANWVRNEIIFAALLPTVTLRFSGELDAGEEDVPNPPLPAKVPFPLGKPRRCLDERTR